MLFIRRQENLMIYITIGLIVGIIMGLTGAGGAMISIPLFIGFLDTSLRDATVLSLVAVIFGTAVNLIGQISKINKKIAISMSSAGAMTNYISLPLKTETPEIVIASLLTGLGIYSIASVWSKNIKPSSAEEEAHIILKALLAGSLLGLITTLTGLGGGVILIPILIKFFGKNYQDALPTSLATILLISLTSFILQSKVALSLISFIQLSLIAGGAILAFLMLQLFIKKMNEKRILQTRKFTFTIVTIYSIISVIIKVV